MDKKELFSMLAEKELTEYGSVIPIDLVRAALGIKYPEYGTKKEFDELALAELSAIDYCRKALLKDGKYLAQERGSYRVLLPSENRAQVKAYMSAADRKLKAAMTLERMTPSDAKKAKESADVVTRIIMKQDSIARFGESAALA